MLFGALLTWGRAVMEEQIRGFLKQAIVMLYGHKTAIEATELAQHALRITAPFGMIIFSFGTIIFLLCVFGCIGASCNSALCLKIYLGFLIFFTVLEIVALAFYYSRRSTVFNIVRRILKQSLLRYRSKESRDAHSMLFNVMMPPVSFYQNTVKPQSQSRLLNVFQLHCCGLHNASDFDQAKDFDHQYNTTTGLINITYPVTCCKMDHSYVIQDNTCPGKFDSNNSNIDRGCWEQLYPHLVYYGNAGAVAGLIVLLFQRIVEIPPDSSEKGFV
ncbi:tetraspanin family protein [Opisthorchis viverrini]|uniref:Tetraspanin family protein n=1 Tax=Opisthorchis viverrini TaxID=6198 RepID=A0A1S8WZL2_OPIVI|nr:tetraspanin family protein [Opisthorchis viverrini]